MNTSAGSGAPKSEGMPAIGGERPRSGEKKRPRLKKAAPPDVSSAGSPVKQQYVVIGAGMTGLAAAHLLAREGHAVTLLENRPAIGGVNGGLAWEGFSLDFGCHLFGNESDAATGVLLELMQGEVVPVEVQFASFLAGQRTDGFELPNLASLGQRTADRILHELLERCTQQAQEPRTLYELLDGRYGPTAAAALDGCVRKVFAAGADTLAPQAVSATTFRRIRVVSDDVAGLLKRLDVLDDRLAQGSADDPMRFYRNKVKLYEHRSFYPASGGMAGFVQRARRVLEQEGVVIHTGVTLRALSLHHEPRVSTEAHGEFSPNQIVWTLGLGRLEPWLGGTNNISGCTSSVPMVLYYFAIDKSQETGLSYANDFNPNTRVFRASVPGSYGPGNCPPGLSYVCCEVPTHFDSEIWQDPARFEAAIWTEALGLGVATGSPKGCLSMKARESYKAPRAEFWEKSESLRARLQNEPSLLVTDEWSFSTNRSILELKEKLSQKSAAA